MDDGMPRDRASVADARAAIRFDTFLFAAAATVLITRTYLKLTGYPQVGGHSQLHVAHVLWGGLLLFIAMIIMMVAIGSNAKFWASLIGGVGFGLFIDEIGKFLTKDVNYFFKPAIAIIYGVLITAYVVGREVLRRVKLTGPRTRALVAIGIADNELGQLTAARRDALSEQLELFSGDASDTALRALLESTPPRRPRSSEELAATVVRVTHQVFIVLAQRRWVRRVVVAILLYEVLSAFADVLYVIIGVWATNLDKSHISASDYATFAGNTVEMVLVGGGLFLLARHDWNTGLRIMRMGLFIALMFSTVMEFADQQLHAITDFAVIVVLYAIIGATGEAERRGEIAPTARRQRNKLRRDDRATENLAPAG